MIIKTLLEENQCFAVVQSYSFLTKAKILVNQEWEVIASEKDYHKLKGFKFLKLNDAQLPPRHRNPEGIISITLELDEIQEFKNLYEDYFTKVVENENGRVWEITENPFKEHLNPKNNERKKIIRRSF